MSKVLSIRNRTRFSCLLFFISLLLSSSAFAKNIAVILSFDCDPEGSFGSISENQISVLKGFGWNVIYYCGSDLDGRYLRSTKRNGALTKENLLFGFDNLHIEDGDNVLMSLFTHGGFDRKLPTFSPRSSYITKEFDPETQGIDSFKKNSDLKEEINFKASDYMEKVSEIENKNPNGTNILINESCFGGACVRFLPQQSNTCVITSAPEDAAGVLENFLTIAFQNLPNSKRFSHPEFNQESLNMIKDIRSRQIVDSLNKSQVTYLKSLKNKIIFSSYTLREIFHNALWFDKSETVAVYTRGFNLDSLNVSTDEQFIKQYKNIMLKFSENSKKKICRNFVEIERLSSI